MLSQVQRVAMSMKPHLSMVQNDAHVAFGTVEWRCYGGVTL